MNQLTGYSPLLNRIMGELSSLSSAQLPITPDDAEMRNRISRQFPHLELIGDQDKSLCLGSGDLYRRRITDRANEESGKVFDSSSSSSIVEEEEIEGGTKRQKCGLSSDERGMIFSAKEEELSIEPTASSIDDDDEMEEELLDTNSAGLSEINQPEVAERVSRLRHTALVYSAGISVDYLDKLNEVLTQTSKYEDDLEAWDNSISEVGIADNMDIITQGRQSRIYIKHAVEKGAFIGALAGTLSLLDYPGSKSIPFASFSKGVFYLNRAYSGNFLQDLPVSENGNVSLKPVYSEESSELQFILVAKKKISARENLTLQKFTPVTFTVSCNKRGIE